MTTFETCLDSSELQSDTASTLPQDNISSDVGAAEDKIQEQDQELSTPGGVFEKVLSRTRSRTSYLDPGPPPDGGMRA